MSDHISTAISKRFEAHFEALYGEEGSSLARNLLDKLSAFAPDIHPPPKTLWDQQDLLLITYGDSIRTVGAAPLRTLHQFLCERLADTFSSVHILPYFPYSSDDGFAVIDYLKVNPELGDWPDIERIAIDFRLMTDLVINHVSSQHRWLQNFLQDLDPGRDYFIEVDPETDLSMVVRPRTTPLLTRFETNKGSRWLWTTFSADQVDTNFHNPKVLFEYIDILLAYLGRGSKLIRLDAIAYLWKEIGTPCIHLPQTHTVVKLLREMVDLVAPGTLLITETNVPHQENISYFGEGDEAQVVYQFPLPPLVLHAFYRGDASHLTHWARNLDPPPQGCTFLNFLSSHDGIGLRPLEGLVTDQEVLDLVDGMRTLGGKASMRTRPDGSQAPYELNISWFSAMQGTCRGKDGLGIKRHLCAHAIMLALQGIPAFYILSLLGTENDLEGVERTGAARSINRHKWDHQALESLLNDPNSVHRSVLSRLQDLIRIRREQPAFHPDAHQQIHDMGPEVFVVERICQEQTLVAVHNVTPKSHTLSVPEGVWRELISSSRINGTLDLPPYGTAWLSQSCPPPTR